MATIFQFLYRMSPWLIPVVLSAITALIVAYINNRMLFFGKLRIYSRFEVCHIVATKQDVNNDYILRCICFNSKSIPVYLEDFSIEMKVPSARKVKIIQVSNPDLSLYNTGCINITASSVVAAQVIPPRVIHEFKIKLNSDGEIATISRLKLVCINERHRKLTFILKNGVKLNKNNNVTKYNKDIINKWRQNNTAYF